MSLGQGFLLVTVLGMTIVPDKASKALYYFLILFFGIGAQASALLFLVWISSDFIPYAPVAALVVAAGGLVTSVDVFNPVQRLKKLSLPQNENADARKKRQYAPAQAGPQLMPKETVLHASI